MDKCWNKKIFQNINFWRQKKKEHDPGIKTAKSFSGLLKHFKKPPSL